MRPACTPHDLSLFAYGFLEADECAAVEAHLESCPRCREAAERLLLERELVAFELGVEAGLAIAEDEETAAPVPTPAPVLERRRPRRRLLAYAAAAAVLLIASVTAWLAVRPAAPEEGGWTPLPDGSRYRVVDRADVAEPREPRRLDLAAGSLILDVVDDDAEFEVATPHGTVRAGEGRFVVSVVDGTTLVEVIDGRVRLEPIEGGREQVVPTDDGEVRVMVVEVVRDPELLARIAELEARLRELGESVGEPEGSTPLPADEAIERHDWSLTARTLLETAADARAGRLPRDPVVRRRYLRRLAELGRLADSLGVEPSVEAVARDPRAGPQLVAATVQRLWPEAPEGDVERVRTRTADALRRYADANAAAATPAEKNAAEADLRRDLTDTIEAFEEVHGPPAEDPVSVVPAIPGVEDESPGNDPEPTRPGGNTEPVRPGSGDTESGNASGSPSTGQETDAAPTTATRVLSAVGYEWSKPRVLRGTPAEIVRQVVEHWVADRGHADADRSRLLALSEEWVRDARGLLARAPRSVVLALEAELGRGTAPADVPAAQVSRLRSELMAVQQRVEVRLPAADRSVSTPTYFLFDR